MPNHNQLPCECQTCEEIAIFEEKVENFYRQYPITAFDVKGKVCPKCGRSFRSARIYKRHIWWHCEKMERLLSKKLNVTLTDCM